MGKFIDLTGQKFGRLTVISRAENSKINGHIKVRYNSLCDCGKYCVVYASDLKSGNTRSCGCLHDERCRERATTHGLGHTPIYGTWCNMKARCFNPNNTDYSRYGGRSITIFESWCEDFQAFYDYVSQLEHYGEENYTLDRIDVNGNYEPGNVRWADAKTQRRNQARTISIEYNGKTMCLKDAAELSGIKVTTLWVRYKNGDRGERLFRPVRRF